MILTITFGPCIDKSTSVPSLIPHKKMRCSEPKLEPGGGGINVARAVKKLGGIATAVFPSGGYTGKYLEELMTREAVPSIIVNTEKETRENMMVVDTSTNLQYRFVTPGATLNKTECQQLLKAVEEAQDLEFIVASGSLPPGVPPEIFADLSAIAQKKKAFFIADTSGEALRYAVDKGVYLLKPNLGELCSLVNKPHLLPDEIARAARQIINEKNCTAIVVSMGPGGAMLVTKDIIQTITAPRVQSQGTVGAGDSMVAGIVFALSKGESLETAVQYGVACGTAATMNPGTELCHKEDADRLFSLILSQKTGQQLSSYQGSHQEQA